MLGAVWGVLAGNRLERFLAPGRTLDLLSRNGDSQVSILLEAFQVDRDPAGRAEQFRSQLHLEENGNAIDREISVNHPLRHRGITIYQADWSLAAITLQIGRSPQLQLPLRSLLTHADLWLARSTHTPLFSVTTKPAVPSRSFNCSQHCFYSLGTYWWPNNATADGLPYVRRDGLVNPETFEYDSIPLSQMLFALSNLSLAYYFTRNASFAAGAAALARFRLR